LERPFFLLDRRILFFGGILNNDSQQD
jgi:hypothetical protein